MILVQETLKGGRLYPLAESSDIRGGLLIVDSFKELSTINENLLVEGQMAFIKAIKNYYRYTDQKDWIEFKVDSSLLQVSSEEPTDKYSLWLDTSNDYNKTTSATVESLLNDVSNLKKIVSSLLLLRTNGVISGTLDDSTLSEIAEESEPLKPSILGDDDDDPSTERPNTSSDSGKTVNHITIKTGTFEAIKSAYKIGNIIDNELVWATDKLKMYFPFKGKIYPIGSGSSQEIDNNPDDMTNEELQAYLDKLGSIGFTAVDDPSKNYVVSVNRYGNIEVHDKTLDTRQPEPYQAPYFPDGGNTLSDWKYDVDDQSYKCSVSPDRFGDLYINSIYLGGTDTDELSYQPCSHNYVEISNISEKDINLNGFSLFYSASKSGGDFERLDLFGTIKAGSTFLIRGAQCSVMDTNTTYLKVKTYDMEWYSSSDELMKFARSGVCFYLAWTSDEGKIYTIDGSVKDINSISDSSEIMTVSIADTGAYDIVQCAYGYCGCIGIGEGAFMREKWVFNQSDIDDLSKVIYQQWYSLDPTSQSVKVLAERNTKKFWKAVTLDKVIEPNIEIYTPKASFENKNHSTDKHKFDSTQPNCFTINFGRKATVVGSTLAGRCFTWTSVGYYDEYLFIRKKETSNWECIESIKEGKIYSSESITDPFTYSYPSAFPHSSTSDTSYVSNYYRIRWMTYYGEAVTTHKVILNLSAETYEVCVGRLNDEKNGPSEYCSPIRTVTVKTSADVSSFDFIQTSDQQGANWEEYQTWAISAAFIKANESGFDFIINTGDICYNGSRPCEWVDYFEGYSAYLSDYPESFCIGNNDLAPMDLIECDVNGSTYTTLKKKPAMMQLGNGDEQPYKVNHIVADLFYTFEMDPDNMPVFTNTSLDGKSSTSYKIPCLYSFDYGSYHFVCLNSEIRTSTNKSDSASSAPNTVDGEFKVKDDIVNDNTSVSLVYKNVEKWLVKDLCSWKGITSDVVDKGLYWNNSELTDCSKCIVFTHEMPFSIVATTKYTTYAANSTAPRENAKASLNRHFDFMFQRLFKTWGIRLVIGGHKHTTSVSYPVYDAPYASGITAYDPASDTNNTEALLMQCPTDKSYTFNPIMQLSVNDADFDNILKHFTTWSGTALSQDSTTALLVPGIIYNNSSKSISFNDSKGVTHQLASKDSYTLFEDTYVTGSSDNTRPVCRLEIVDKYTAPKYVMCQATGYKNKSNSDLASALDNRWSEYWVADGGKDQAAPFYNRYKCTDTGIEVQMIRISEMYTANTKAGYWNFTRDVLKKVADYNSYDYNKIRELKANQCSKKIWSSTWDSNSNTRTVTFDVNNSLTTKITFAE